MPDNHPISVWPHLHTAAAGAVSAGRDRFAAMVFGLVTEHVVGAPVAVLCGHLRDANPIDLDDALAEYHRRRRKALEYGRRELPRSIVHNLYEDHRITAEVLYEGDELEAITAVLHNSPVGSEDVCVVFDGLRAPDGQYADALSYVAAYATVEPVTLRSEGHVYRMPDGRILNEDPRLVPGLGVVGDRIKHIWARQAAAWAAG